MKTERIVPPPPQVKKSGKGTEGHQGVSVCKYQTASGTKESGVSSRVFQPLDIEEVTERSCVGFHQACPSLGGSRLPLAHLLLTIACGKMTIRVHHSQAHLTDCASITNIQIYIFPLLDYKVFK